MISKTATLNLPIELKNTIKIAAFAGISVLSFSIPFFLGYPQWLIGTIVNACLFSAAIFLPKKFFLPLIIFPSLGVLLRGVIFGPFTPFLAYFLPFIWLGNLVLILSFKKLYSFNYPVSVFFAAFAKYLFLMIIANIYFKFQVVPAIFLQAMGLGQFLTALAGGMISLVVFNIWKTKHQKQKN